LQDRLGLGRAIGAMTWRPAALTTTAAILAATAAHAQTAGAGGADLGSDLSRWSRWPVEVKTEPPVVAGAEFQLGALPDGAERLRLGPTGLRARDNAGGADGRWFMFAGARSNELGRNESAWPSAPWAEDHASGSMTRAEAGIALRSGNAQASFGYVRRKVKVSGAQSDLLANMPKTDHVAGFSFSYTLR
jgi:hypothetical protein